MGQEVIVNCVPGETRAAFLENRKVVDLHIERENSAHIAGNIYKGRVENVLPGMSAAFVDIGVERNAFLYVEDAVDPGARANGGKQKPHSIREILSEGQEIIVQVSKEPIGTKGARVVTQITIPGRYLVLMPTADYIGVSRRITNEKERERLKGIAASIKPDGMGLIVRTVAEGRDEADLVRDLRFLAQVWAKISRRAKKQSPPALLYRDHDLLYRIVRDYLTDDVDKVVIDSKEEYARTLELVESLSPRMRSRVFFYHEGIPIFEFYGVESDIERALRRKVWLDCGGYLVIDYTEALVSIDVNTGKYIGGKNLRETVLTTNLQAAEEIARQLRLRDLGGIIIVDFIDMEDEADNQKVIAKLEEEFRRDKTKTHVLGFTNLGMVEITRKKVKEDLGALLQKPCPYCEGTGRVLSEETMAIQAEREIRKIARERDVEAILIGVHPSVAALVIGAGGTNLRRLENETGKAIYVKGKENMHVEQIDVLAAGSVEQVEKAALPVREGQILDVLVEEPHMNNPRDGISRLEGFVIDIENGGAYIGKRLKVKISKVYRTYARGMVLSG